MKKFLALIIVLGLPLVAIPAGAAQGLGNMSCSDIQDRAAGHLEVWKDKADTITDFEPDSLAQQKLIEEIELQGRLIIQWATVYQAFCRR